MDSPGLKTLFRGILVASLPLALGASDPVEVRVRTLAQPLTGQPTQLDAAQCARICDPSTSGSARLLGCSLNTTQEGLPELSCSYQQPTRCGRRPAGLLAWTSADQEALARYFARAAYEEAAAVHAFLILEEELAAHGAPQELRRAAARSAQDEVRHARVMRALARRAGARDFSPPEVARQAPRPLLEVALENAVEGCVHEAYAALSALWQACAAAGRRTRAALSRIADDEVRHAELAFAVARWAAGRLSPEERRQVSAARREALEALRLAALSPPPELLLREVGLPSAAQAQAMVRGLALLDPTQEVA
jgi:hypothetical protein